jgi:hypothetical protein
MKCNWRFLILLAYLFFFKNVSFAQDSFNKAFSCIAFGDMPYFLPEDYSRFSNLIQQVNMEDEAFNVFEGDFESSSTPCSNAAFDTIRSYFDLFKKPLIYTPGDNEWTDCHQKSAGSYSPEERLEKIRKLFFYDSLSFGNEKMLINTQLQYKAYKKFVENRSWNYNNVSFATMHIVGSNNNLFLDSLSQNLEFNERLKADIFWLNLVFSKAIEDQSSGVVLFVYADMFLPPLPPIGVKELLATIQQLVSDFEKPVLLVHGDTHQFIIDKPLYTDRKKTKYLLNFTRLPVFGENDMHAKITINPLLVFKNFGLKTTNKYFKLKIVKS